MDLIGFFSEILRDDRCFLERNLKKRLPFLSKAHSNRSTKRSKGKIFEWLRRSIHPRSMRWKKTPVWDYIMFSAGKDWILPTAPSKCSAHPVPHPRGGGI